MRHVPQNNDHAVEETSVAGLSVAGTAQLLRALVESHGKRIASATLDGCCVWIKRFDAVNRGFAKWLHTASSTLATRLFAPVTSALSFIGSFAWLGGDARRILNAGLLLRETLNSTRIEPPAPYGKSAP